MTDIAQEDKNTIDKFFDTLKDMATTSGEVTLNKIGDCISKMPIGDLQNMGKLVKTYGYYGAFFAIQESIENKDLGPIGKYALATGAAVLIIPATATVTSTVIASFLIGSLVSLTWDYIEEHQDDIFNEIKSMLAAVGLDIEENGNLKINTDVIAERIPSLTFNSPISSLQELYDTAERTTSPLIVDLDGDGVETTSVADGVYFDHDGNGFAEKSAWVGKDDGLLVRDINGNGQIDNGTELFGNNSVLSNGQKATNGFEALKDLDSNNDGVFNNQDAAWNEVKVWKDSNSNGIVEAGELLTLEQAGITGFDLDYHTQSRDDTNGNAHLQTSTITKADGTTAAITDVWFKTDTANSIDTMNITIPDDIKALPDVAGFGNVHSLHIAMALDESGELKALAV